MLSQGAFALPWAFSDKRERSQQKLHADTWIRQTDVTHPLLRCEAEGDLFSKFMTDSGFLMGSKVSFRDFPAF